MRTTTQAAHAPPPRTMKTSRRHTIAGVCAWKTQRTAIDLNCEHLYWVLRTRKVHAGNQVGGAPGSRDLQVRGSPRLKSRHSCQIYSLKSVEWPHPSLMRQVALRLLFDASCNLLKNKTKRGDTYFTEVHTSISSISPPSLFPDRKHLRIG